MFKLIKINGARTNVPELDIVPVDGQSCYTAGCLYYLGRDGLASTPYADNDLKFIPIDTLDIDSGICEIKGYFVNEHMVFETEIYNYMGNVAPGCILNAHTDCNGDIDGAEGTIGETMMLLNKESARYDGKVLVALKW